MVPVLSVVIPTCRRPLFLERAINSALMLAAGGNVEVIVVPNGADLSWVEVAEIFAGDPRVTFHPIQTAHACAARNHGLELAKGKYIRFLDDDDFLYPDAAIAQLELISSAGAEICSANVDIVDERGVVAHVWRLPKVQDFASSVLSVHRLTLPTAHIFLRESIKNIKWNSALAISQDTDWMIQLAVYKDFFWVTMDVSVGVWVKHRGARISSGYRVADVEKRIANMIMEGADKLSTTDRLSASRRTAVAEGLWGCIQKAMMYAPIYWYKVANIALAYDKKVTPPSKIYRFKLFSIFGPLFVEIILIPVRYIHVFFCRAGSFLSRSWR